MGHEARTSLSGFPVFPWGPRKRSLFQSRTFPQRCCGELTDSDVIGLDRFVVTTPLDGDAVFRACRLILKSNEIGVRLQLRVVFHHSFH